MFTGTQHGDITKPDIVVIMLRDGVALRQRGRKYWTRCPFHEDRHPSFMVDPQNQRWHCFGCGEGGDVIDFMMKRHGLSFGGALTRLGIKQGRTVTVDPQASRRRAIQMRFDAEITIRYRNLCDESMALHRLRLAVRKNSAKLTEVQAFQFAELMARLDWVDYQLDLLWNGDLKDKISVLKEARNAVSTAGSR